MDVTCAIRCKNQETLDHLFMPWHFVKAIWFGASQGLIESPLGPFNKFGRIDNTINREL